MIAMLQNDATVRYINDLAAFCMQKVYLAASPTTELETSDSNEARAFVMESRQHSALLAFICEADYTYDA